MERALQIKLTKVQLMDFSNYLPNKETGQHEPSFVAEHLQNVDEVVHVRRLTEAENVGWTDKTKTTWPQVEDFPSLKNTYSKSDSEGQREEVPQGGVSEEPGKPCGQHHQPFRPTIHRDHSPIINFTIPPTEEDLKLLQSVQDKKGHIKRPVNAFFVWAHIHRNALQKACSLTGSQDISIQLGRVWSKLTNEEKRPYFEAAHKLRVLHNQQFPDYEYHPKKRKCKEQFTIAQRARLEKGRQQALSTPCFVLQAMPVAQPNLPDVHMNACPMLVPYTMYSQPYSTFPSNQYEYFSMFQIHSPRLFYTSTIHQQLHGGTDYSSLYSPAGSGVCSGFLQPEPMQLRHHPGWCPY